MVLPLVLQRLDPAYLLHQFRHGRNVEIAFQQGGEDAKGFVGFVQQRPDACDDIGPMGVDDQVFGFVIMACDVTIGDTVAPAVPAGTRWRRNGD